MSYLEQNGYFIFDDVVSSDYGVWINGGGTYNAAKRQYTSIAVPGRNGTLTIDNGAYEEIEHTYTAFIAKDFDTNIAEFRNELLSKPGYRKLYDTYHPDEFYRAKYMDGLNVNVAPAGVGGAFTLTFKRDPRRFLKSGEYIKKPLSGDKIYNPTKYHSKPLIQVTGYGTLTIGNLSMVIANAYPLITIDCETMDCYYGTTNANGAVTLTEFFDLAPGENGITYSNTITEVLVKPRWWYL